MGPFISPPFLPDFLQGSCGCSLHPFLSSGNAGAPLSGTAPEMQAAVSPRHTRSVQTCSFSIKNQPKGAALRFALQPSLLQLFPSPHCGTATGALCRVWAGEEASPVHNPRHFPRAFQCTEHPSAAHLRVIQLVCFHFILFAKEVAGTFLLIYFYLMLFLQKAKTKRTQQNEKEECSHSHGGKTTLCPTEPRVLPARPGPSAEHPCNVPAASGKDFAGENPHLPSHLDLPPHCCMCCMYASCFLPRAQRGMPKDLGQPIPLSWLCAPISPTPASSRCCREEDVEQSQRCAANINYPLTALQAAIRSWLSNSCSQPPARGTLLWGAGRGRWGPGMAVGRGARAAAFRAGGF